MPDFDVFLSYSSGDKAIVAQLAAELKQLGLEVWFDEWVRTPGTPWQPDLLEGVEESAATAVCLGSAEMGKWQRVEMETALAKQVEGQHRVIPVVLPNVPEDKVQLPPLLKRNTWVLLSENLSDRGTLERLYWGITGKKLSQASPEPIKPEPVSNQAVARAIDSLRDTLKNDNVTYLLGSGTSQGDAMLPPSACEIARGLLLDLRLIDSDYSQLLPPVDVAGSYYAVRSGVTKLEGRIVDMIANRSANVPGAHRRLAQLVSILANR